MHYSVRLLTLEPGQVPAKVDAIGTALQKLGLQGRLQACLYSEVGTLNRVLLLHAHEERDILAADQEKVIAARDAFGVADVLQASTFDLFTGFAGHEPLPAGKHGRIYEVRTYHILASGVEPTQAAWAKVLRERLEISKLLAVMYSTTGKPRFMHFWPYASFEERLLLRAKAIFPRKMRKARNA